MDYQKQVNCVVVDVLCVMVIYLRNGTDTTEDCSRCSDGKLDL